MTKSKVNHDVPKRIDPVEEYRRGFEDMRDTAVLNLKGMAEKMSDFDDLAAATISFVAIYLAKYRPPE